MTTDLTDHTNAQMLAHLRRLITELEQLVTEIDRREEVEQQ